MKNQQLKKKLWVCVLMQKTTKPSVTGRFANRPPCVEVALQCFTSLNQCGNTVPEQASILLPKH